MDPGLLELTFILLSGTDLLLSGADLLLSWADLLLSLTCRNPSQGLHLSPIAVQSPETPPDLLSQLPPVPLHPLLFISVLAAV